MKRKIKSLMPSLKERNRYVVFKVIQPGTYNAALERNIVISELLDSMESYMGAANAAEAGLSAIEYSNGKGILRTSHKRADDVKSAMLFVNELHGSKVILRSEGVSGTITKARTKYNEPRR